MITVVTAFVFLAVALGGIALAWWAGTRRESVPQRFQEVLAPSIPEGAVRPGGIAAWFDRLAGKLHWSGRRSDDDIVATLSAEGTAGARLLLSQAGIRHPASAGVYRVLCIATPLALAVLALVAGKLAGLPDRAVAVLVAAAAVAGLSLPAAYLKMRARRRREDITDALPDSLDLLTVCVEAGLGINSAFVRIADEFRLSCPTLSEEFDIVNREMVAGKPRAEALRALADRTGVEDVKSLVAMLVQTDKLGTSLAQSLRVQADSLRVRRRQRAEEAAAKTTIKLVFPLVFLLFPALFIVILGPGVLQIVRVLFPASGGH